MFFYIPELLSSVFWWVQTFLRGISLWEKRMTFILCCGAFCLFFDFFFCTGSLLVADLEAAV